MVYSTDYGLKKELDHLMYGFQKHDNNLKLIIDDVAKQLNIQHLKSRNPREKDMNHKLPENVQTRICYTGTILATKFNNIKDLIKKSQQHNVVYYATCS